MLSSPVLGLISFLLYHSFLLYSYKENTIYTTRFKYLKGLYVAVCFSLGGWNNNPTAGQFQGIFRKLMYRCGVKPVDSGNVRGQDATVTLSAEHYTRVSLSAAEMSSADAATAEELVSPFLNISALVGDHSYLPTRFGALVENALVYIAGFVVRCIFRSLSCDVCRASLVTDALAVPFDQSYHLLELRNNGGLMIPSKGTVKVSKNIHKLLYIQLACCQTMTNSPTHPHTVTALTFSKSLFEGGESCGEVNTSTLFRESP